LSAEYTRFAYCAVAQVFLGALVAKSLCRAKSKYSAVESMGMPFEKAVGKDANTKRIP